MSDIYSFYQLISKYQIEIPIIQRDYAQGRNNSKAADVRKSLVDNMIKAVKEDKPLFFDFVYGRVDNNKFIPFDGQQRLTTLFLFHKYVFEKCQSDSGCNHKDNCSCRGILGRFSYATRQSSREFCKKLVENNIIPDDKYKNQLRETFIAALKKEDNEKEKKADEFIKSIDNWIYRFVINQPWFYPDWEKDPTVMGMLTMLDEIHCQMKKNETDFKTSDFKKFAEKLTSGCNCPITFHFVDMGEHKMSDETYVKMNARGKILTPFENFKASLEQYLDGINNDLLFCFKDNVDGKWLDLFWNVNDNVLPDSYMMSFVNRHFMNVWRCWYGQNTKSEKDRKDMSEDEREEQLENDKFNQRIIGELLLYPTQDDFVSWDIYKGVLSKCGVEDCLNSIFNIWNKLCDPNNTISEDCQAVWNRGELGKKWNLFEGEKNKENRETYPSRVVFYALMRYFREDNNNAKTTLSQWMRVVWNIIENSSIVEDTYQAALRLMKKLSEKCYNIYDTMANHFEEFGLSNQYHAQEQVKEEVNKAKQIVNSGNDWENKIIEAEKYAFFKGAIRFLFTDGEGNINWHDFDSKWKNAQKYFKEIPEQKNVMNEEFDNANLLKALINRFTQQNYWKVLNWYYRVFNNSSATWRYYLLNNNINRPVHEIMMGNVGIQELEHSQDEAQNRLCQLSNTNLLDFVIKEIPQSWIRNYHGHKAIFPSSTGVFLDAGNRDEKLHIEVIKLVNEELVTVPGTKFLYGSDIQFIYQSKYFQWHREGYVRLIQDLNECKPILKNKDGEDNQDNWYWFTPSTETETFIKQLDCLIAQAYPNESDKTYCVNCQSKICN